MDNEKLVPGTPIWEEEIEKAIKGASAVIVILSPDSKESVWVRREISFAEQYNKRVFPILVRGDEDSSITLRLITRQYVDIRENEDIGLNSLSAATLFYLEELEAQEKIAQEQAEKLARAQAEREIAERKAASLKAEREAAEKAAREAAEKAERDAIELAALKKTERQAAEKAEREAVELVALRKTEREAIAARLESERIAVSKVEDEHINYTIIDAELSGQKKIKGEQKVVQVGMNSKHSFTQLNILKQIIGNKDQFFFFLARKNFIRRDIRSAFRCNKLYILLSYYNDFHSYTPELLLVALAFTLICGLAGLAAYPHKYQ